MTNDTIVSVEHLYKKYCKSVKASMYYGIVDIARNTIGMSARSHRLRRNEFWALDDVSFEIKRGETLSIVGPNGSGKTTLLKMLNGIFWPDKGRVSIRGKVGALIEVGAGFHPLLTGKENIYVNAAILGMRKKEVDKKFDAIVGFADIGDFINVPVKYYSSGMFVRLGFAIAVHCEPDVMLIDEILAVGDIGFRVKCYNKIAELAKQCATVIVSHDVSAMARISTKTIVVNKGTIIFQGLPDKAMQYYSSIFEQEKAVIDSEGVRLVSNEMRMECENGCFLSPIGSHIELDLILFSEAKIDPAIFMLTFKHSSGEFVAEWNSWYAGTNIKLYEGEQRLRITVGPIWLNPGVYYLSLVITSQNRMEHLLMVYHGWTLKITGERCGNVPCQFDGQISRIVE
jgi:lipopolysaccharide transport system ATP-binding protein